MWRRKKYRPQNSACSTTLGTRLFSRSFTKGSASPCTRASRSKPARNVAKASASSGSSQYVAGSRLRLATSDAKRADAASAAIEGAVALAAEVLLVAGRTVSSSATAALKSSAVPLIMDLPKSSTRSPTSSHLSETAAPTRSALATAVSASAAPSSPALVRSVMSLSTFCPSFIVSAANAFRSRSKALSSPVADAPNHAVAPVLSSCVLSSPPGRASSSAPTRPFSSSMSLRSGADAAGRTKERVNPKRGRAGGVTGQRASASSRAGGRGRGGDRSTALRIVGGGCERWRGRRRGGWDPPPLRVPPRAGTAIGARRRRTYRGPRTGDPLEGRSSPGGTRAG